MRTVLDYLSGLAIILAIVSWLCAAYHGGQSRDGWEQARSEGRVPWHGLDVELAEPFQTYRRRSRQYAIGFFAMILLACVLAGLAQQF